MRGVKLRSRVTLAAALAALLAAAPPAGAQSFPAPSLTLDTAFAPPSGIVKTDFPPPGSAGTFRDVPAAVAVHGDRIYTVGVAGTGDGQEVAIAARRPDGTPDTGFAGDGTLTLGVGAEADVGTGMTVLPDGRLRVIVATDLSAASDTAFDVAVVGLTDKGLADDTFGDLVGGVRRVVLQPGPNSDVATRIEPGPDGRLAITGSRSDGTRDDLFVALLEANGTPVAGFGTGGISFTPTTTISDQRVDVVFRPGGGLIAWASVDPPVTANDAAAVLRAFKFDGTPDAAFGSGGELVVGSIDTVPGGLIVHGGRLWVSGTTKIGSDTDAFIARANADGTGLQVRRFDVRGRLLPASQAVVSEAHELVAVPGTPELLVAVGSVTYTVEGQSFTDWAAAAFNGLDGDLQSAGFGDVIVQAPGNGELLSAAPGSQGWLAVAGTYVENSDNSFGNARLLIDAEKACDLAVAAGEPGEIVFRGSSPAALTVRVQNVGSRSCSGTLSLPAPYGMTPIATGVLAPGATFVAPAVPVTYRGPRRADDVLLIDLAAPADANTSNNRTAVHVVFSYCDLSVQRVGPAGTIPTEGTRRFELSLRNLGTATCRVRVGSKAPYPLARGRSASDAVAVAAPARARPGTRVRVALRASARDDVEPRNNAVTASPKVVGVGDSDVSSWGSRRFAGTASRGAGDLPSSRLRPARVDVAILREDGRRCSWLSSTRGRFRDGRCGRRHWLRADGTANWRLALRRSLAPGRYVVFSRTTIRAGFPEARFSPKDRNRVEFTVG